MDAKSVYPGDGGGRAQRGPVPRHVFCYYTTGICICFFFLCVFF